MKLCSIGGQAIVHIRLYLRRTLVLSVLLAAAENSGRNTIKIKW